MECRRALTALRDQPQDRLQVAGALPTGQANQVSLSRATGVSGGYPRRPHEAVRSRPVRTAPEIHAVPALLRIIDYQASDCTRLPEASLLAAGSLLSRR